jgi:hypothetical protein
VVEQGGLRESDLLGHLREADAREAAPREELLARSRGSCRATAGACGPELVIDRPIGLI